MAHDTKLWLYYKPKHMVAQCDDPMKYLSIQHYFKFKHDMEIFPVGRLDWKAEGLIPVTNNATLAAALEDPDFTIEREFKVRIWGEMTPEKMERLRKGFVKARKKYPGIVVWEIKGSKNNTRLGVRLYNGRNQVIKRMLYGCDVTVDKIKQIRYGNYKLHGLKPYEFVQVSIGLDCHEAMFKYYKKLLERE